MNNDNAQQTTPPQTLTVAQIADRMGLTARELHSLRLRGLGPEIVQRGLSQIRSTLGVSQLVHFGSQPAKVDDGLIDHLHQQEQALPTEAMSHAGDSVIIAEGPFAGIEAIY